jgi:tetratricopeptide (TPR) repeat protein
MFFRRAFGALLIIIASVLPSLGQNNPGGPARGGGDRPAIARTTFGVAGTVRDDQDHHEMENIRVDLKQATGIPINTTFTRGNGEFEFSGLSSGEYTVEITVQDYEPYRETFTLINASRRGISIFLRRPTTVVSTNSRGAISAHELSVPHKAHDEYEKGLSLLYSKSDYRGAIVQFQRAIKDFPNFYEAYAQEGNAYINLKETAPAEEAMRKSIELSSSQYPDALFLLAGLLNNTNRYSEAEALSRQGVALDTSSWHGHFELARALTALKRAEEAEKSAIQSRDLKPDNPPAYLVLANIHIQLRDYEALLKDLDSYLKLVPTGPGADQARKTRENLQAAMQKAQAEAQSNGQDGSRPTTQDQSKSNTQGQSRPSTQDQAGSSKKDQSGSTEREPAQSKEEDPPLLPHLPPPQP